MNDDETLDLLLSRILDRRAAPADWDAFATRAQARPDSWPQLLAALRSHQGLCNGLDAELVAAERIELPAGSAAAAVVDALPSLADARARRRWSGAAGWAAAALLALSWAGSALQADAGAAQRSPAPVAPPSSLASAPTAPSPLLAAAPSTQPADAAGPRLREGQLPDDLHGSVVGQLPLQLVSTSAAADGSGLDVVFVRPVLERTHVSGVYSLGSDELGRPAPVTANPASFLVADKF